MIIVVPLNLVPDLVEDLEVNDAGTGLDDEYLKLKLNEFDDHALEDALLLKASTQSEVVAIAVASEGVDKTLFTALAKGADRAVKITDASPGLGNRALGQVFASVAKSLKADLILTGVQSVADLEGQIGPVIAAELNAACVSVVTAVESSGAGITVKKEYSGGITAQFEVDLPAVIGIQTAGQLPRYAPVSKVRQIQQSATIDEMAAGVTYEGPTVKVVKLAPPDKGAGAKMLQDAEEILAILKEKGVA